MGFSEKQRKVMRFPYEKEYDVLICDGAVRSGKTSVMSLSFFLWAMGNFNGCAFALCGKSVGAVERNIITPLLSVSYLNREFSLHYHRSEHMLSASRGGKKNRFYLFGGKDESSYTLIQGITLAGVLMDEVALMPRSFVEQAIARCSVDGAKLWFNCNPDGPEHWFFKEWVQKAQKRKALHLHFTMEDNPGLSETTKAQYRSRYSGVFYRRYILGEWVMGEGLIYDMFDLDDNTYTEPPYTMWDVSQRTIAVDYGTTNPCVFYGIYDDGETIRIDEEYRWDSRDPEKGGRQKTDDEYVQDFLKFQGDRWCPVVVDPSAASFIAALRREGVYVIEADNTVSDGIRRVGALLGNRRMLINKERCPGLIAELGSYVWDDKARQAGQEKPLKMKDHGPDAIRYFVNTLPDWRMGLPPLGKEVVQSVQTQ